MVFLEEVAVGLGVAWNAFVVVGENVIGEEELRITAAARAQRHNEQGSFFAEIGGKLMWDQFELGRISAGVFQTFHLFI